MGAEEILAGGGKSGIKLADFANQKVTLVASEVDTGPSKFPQKAVILTLVDGDGNEQQIRTTAVAVVDKSLELQQGGYLPLEVQVTTYPGQGGNPGYDIASV